MEGPINETIPDPTAERIDRRSLGEMVRDLANDSLDLIQQEIALAKAEIRHNLKEIAKHTGQLAVGGGVAAVGLLVLLAFVIVGLGALLGGSYWLSTLIVAVALLIGGAGIGYLGVRGLGSLNLKPEASIESLRETSAWAGDEVSELRASLSGDGSSGPALQAPRGTAPAIRVEHRPTPSDGKGQAGPRGVTGTGAPDTRLPLSEPVYKRVFHEFKEDDVAGQAAKVAYFMFTSLPPALLVLFSLAGFFGGEQLGDYLASQLETNLPGSADDPNTAAGFIHQFVNQVVSETAPGPLSIGLLLGIWAGSTVFVALTDALNKAYDIEDDRGWFKRRGLAIGVMVAFLALFIAGSGILIVGPQIVESIDLGGAASLAWSILQWPLAFLLVVGAFFLVYDLLPNRDQSGCRDVLFKSSAIAAALWLVATIGFRFYVSNFGSYSETYGFVGAILVLLLWMYLTAMVILLGGELSSEMERKA